MQQHLLIQLKMLKSSASQSNKNNEPWKNETFIEEFDAFTPAPGSSCIDGYQNDAFEPVIQRSNVEPEENWCKTFLMLVLLLIFLMFLMN